MPAKMWFGTRGYEEWVPAPAVDMESSHVHYGSRQDQLRGGVSIRNSRGGHQEYGMAWEAIGRRDLALIRDHFDGLYDTATGRGLIHFIDPAAMDRNVLPKLWAAPSLCADGPSLTKGVKPTLTNTPSNNFRLPSSTANFDAPGSTLTLYLPIPPGHSAHIAFYGPVARSNAIAYRTTSGVGAFGDVSYIPVRLNENYGQSGTRIDAGPGVTGLVMYLNDAVALTAGLAVIRETSKGAPPAPSRYVAGEGHSGCKVEPGSVSSLVNSVFHDTVSASARLIEVGSWQ